jgi:RNA polymerase sigma-70 factor (ECF subfamily)
MEIALRGTMTIHPSLLLRLRDPADGQAWTRFVQVYTPLIYGHCVKRGLQPEDAADVAQDVMKSVAAAMPRFNYDRARGTFRGWLLTVTRNRLEVHRDRARRETRVTGGTDVQELIASAPDPRAENREWEHEHRLHLFRWAIGFARAQFVTSTWNAFWQTAVENRPIELVARDLRMTPGAVYIARCRVTSRLRELIESVAE